MASRCIIRIVNCVEIFLQLFDWTQNLCFNEWTTNQTNDITNTTIQRHYFTRNVQHFGGGKKHRFERLIQICRNRKSWNLSYESARKTKPFAEKWSHFISSERFIKKVNMHFDWYTNRLVICCLHEFRSFARTWLTKSLMLLTFNSTWTITNVEFSNFKFKACKSNDVLRTKFMKRKRNLSTLKRAPNRIRVKVIKKKRETAFVKTV